MGPPSPGDADAWAQRGRRRRRRTRFGWTAPTPTEREVGTPAADGLSNKAIAERLHIAPGTVKIHLARIDAKLGVPNRTALVAVVVLRVEVGRQVEVVHRVASAGGGKEHVRIEITAADDHGRVVIQVITVPDLTMLRHRHAPCPRSAA